MKSVGKAALAMVEEVRRQFNTINGLMEGTARPDYSRCVEISTSSSLREMIPPGKQGCVCLDAISGLREWRTRSVAQRLLARVLCSDRSAKAELQLQA